MNATLIFILLFALMLTGMPISISLGLTVLTFLFTMTQVPIESVGLKLFSGLDNFGIMAIPFFILAGTFLTRGGVARRMIAFTTSLVGHFPGGLGLAGVAACAMFAAISGSSVATVVAIGSIMMPAMVEHGYPKRFGVGVISTSGALGILVPPSIILVLYGVSTNTSIGALFMAGVVPGIILASMLAAVTWFIAWRRDYPRMPIEGGRSTYQATLSASFGLFVSLAVTGIPPIIFARLVMFVTPAAERSSGYFAMVLATAAWLVVCSMLFPRRYTPPLRFEARKVWDAYWESIWGLLLIVIVLGGIYGGIFTPTEAAAVAAVYAFVITVFVYKELKLPEVPKKVLLQAASMSSMLLYIITNAVLFSFLMTSEQIPQEMAAWIIDKNFSIVVFLLVVNIILLLAGNVMDPSSILLIMAPILFPLATKLGVHPVHLGVLMIVNTEVGLCHPPVGLNLYIASSIAKMGISEITIAVLPWLCAMLVFLGLITYVPEISLWLPRLLGMI
jgi:C4-dicarboxylate transporter DctM subunit